MVRRGLAGQDRNPVATLQEIAGRRYLRNDRLLFPESPLHQVRHELERVLVKAPSCQSERIAGSYRIRSSNLMLR